MKHSAEEAYDAGEQHPYERDPGTDGEANVGRQNVNAKAIDQEAQDDSESPYPVFAHKSVAYSKFARRSRRRCFTAGHS